MGHGMSSDFQMTTRVGGIAGRWIAMGFAACCLLSLSVGAGAVRSLALSDMALRVGLSSPAISPDGKRIAVVLSRANFAENRYEQSLVLVDAVTGAQQVLHAAGISADSPQWSPDGARLAWLESDPQGQPQIHTLAVNETGSTALRVTNAIGGVRTNVPEFRSFEWSPDGRSIAYITSDPPEVRTGEERFNRSFEVIDNDYLATAATPSFHAWIVSAGGGNARRLNSGLESTTGLVWSRNGRSLIVVIQPRPHNSAIDYAEFIHASSTDTQVKVVDVATGAMPAIVPDKARVLPAPAVSPDGSTIAFRHSRGPEPWVHPANLAVVSMSGGEVRDLTTELDRDIQEFAWLASSQQLLLKAADRVGSALWVQPLNGKVRRLDVGSVIELQGLTLSKTGALAFIGSESQHPAEIYVMKSLDEKPRRLTQFNEAIAGFNLGRSETITWRLDGFEHSGVLTFPPDFKDGAKLPLVLHIHGGPQSTSTQAFDYFGQVLAAQGWVVFKPNYRGSNPQGDVYQSAIVNDFGDGPGRDIMTGIAAVKARGFVDADRIAVSGWSYGGYLSAWLIGHYQDFRAAVIGAPMTDILSWYNLSCCNAWAAEMAGGSPWVNGNYVNYWRQSPVAYADKVKTPTLLLHRTGDPEAPLPESYYFYHALRDNGVMVKFIAYPLAGHGYEYDPVNERDTMRRWMGWIDEQFRTGGPDRR